MKNLRFLSLLLALTLPGLQSCQINTPPAQNDEPELASRLESSATFHYHDGQSSTAREMILSRYSDGSVIIQRSDVALSAATNLVSFVTLDSDPIPANSTSNAVYNPGSNAWFVPFGSGDQVALQAGGDEVDVWCDCNRTAGTRPGDFPYCSLGDVNFAGSFWECVPNSDCSACYVKIVFSGKQISEPGITLKASQITLQ